MNNPSPTQHPESAPQPRILSPNRETELRLAAAIIVMRYGHMLQEASK
jgi:hypothetical protein